MPHTNPTSSIRSGFDYQNFWSLRLCGEWLVNPARYKRIQFETCPDEDNPNRFYLDDIVCLDSDDYYNFYQFKYRQDPENEWTWDNLLITEKPRGSSIVKKWASSLSPRIDKTKKAFFITNGKAADEITKYTSNEILDIQRVKNEDNDLYLRLTAEIGDELELDRFFQIFHFQFDQENLSDDELENSIRKYFYKNLSATASGVTNLYHEISKECRQRNPRLMDIETLRKWCEFDVPRSLEEQFVIPPDFEFFDDATHQSILSDLQKSEGGIKVIFGKPGVGKSVFLSKLDKDLKEKHIVSIKHHYHISPEDSSPLERLNTERIIEAIKSQLKSYKEELGDLANKNSKDIAIREFIGTIATKLNKEDKAMVIIVDGLDHVLRYGEKEEMESFLKEICLPQPGVWIIIGMQEIAEPHLPQIVFDKCPKVQWTEIKGLSEKAVANLIRVNSTNIHLPDQEDQLKELTEKLFSITGGNPLHLRYSLQQLKNLFGNALITDYSCNDLVPYSDSIERYYESLWKQISYNAKTVLLTIASVNFLFTEKQLIECASSYVSNPADITKGFNEISHLVSKNRRDQVSVYHNSFEVFLKNQEEMKQQRTVIKMNVKKWLQKSDYEYLKWAELRIIEHEPGNSNPLLAIDKQWLIDSICFPCNPDQISNQMKLAARVACENGDFGKGLQISYLHVYYLNSREFVDEASELIWSEALNQNPTFFEYIAFGSLPVPLLAEIAEKADARGDSLSMEDITEILINIVNREEYRQNSAPPATVTFLKTIPFNHGSSLDKIYKFVIQFRDLNITETLFKSYCHSLLMLGQNSKILALLKLKLTQSEKQTILIECTKYGLNNGEDISKYFSGQKELPIFCLVYQAIRKEQFNLPKFLAGSASYLSKGREHDSEEREKWRKFYHDNFLVGLLYGLSDKEKDIEEWTANAPNTWTAKAVASILAASLKVSSGISESKIAYSDVFDSFDQLEILEWPKDRDSLGFQSALRDALGDIMRDVISFKNYLKDDCIINISDNTVITNKPSLFSKIDLIDLVLEDNKPLLSIDLYGQIRDEKLTELTGTVNYFPERAKDYSNLSKLARIHGEQELSKRLLKEAADNLLGYGYHKDTYLFDVLEAIEFCGQSGINKDKINGWVTRIIPLIHNVGEYTDGDETHGLPYELADLLAKEDPGLLRKYYYWSADKEEFYATEDLFQNLCPSGKSVQPCNRL